MRGSEADGVREAIAARREHDFQRSQEFAADREASIRLDEETDLSERLFMPMENSFTYQLREGKLYSEFGDQLDAIFTKGYLDLREHAADRPDLAFEINRRYEDIRELHCAERLAPGETMIVFSPIPDVIREGRTHIDAYNRERLKMLVRVYEHRSDHAGMFTITSFSLDGSNYQAMQAAAQEVGVIIEDGLTSEQIVAQRHVFAAQDDRLEEVQKLATTNQEPLAKAMTDRLRRGYDRSLSQRLGGEWYAGRPAVTTADALGFIRSQPAIVDAHMRVVKDIMAQALDADRRQQLLVEARYNCAAALDDILHGKSVESLDQAGADARSEGRDYSGDCALTPLGSSEAQIERLGYRGDSLKCVTCPLPGCGKMVDAHRTVEGGIFCPACRREARGGRIINHAQPAHGQERGMLAQPVVERSSQPPGTVRSTIEFQHEVAIGTATITARNANGQVIATGDIARALYLQSRRQS